MVSNLSKRKISNSNSGKYVLKKIRLTVSTLDIFTKKKNKKKAKAYKKESFFFQSKNSPDCYAQQEETCFQDSCLIPSMKTIITKFATSLSK